VPKIKLQISRSNQMQLEDQMKIKKDLQRKMTTASAIGRSRYG